MKVHLVAGHVVPSEHSSRASSPWVTVQIVGVAGGVVVVVVVVVVVFGVVVGV